MVHSSRRRNFNNKKKGHEPRENKWRDDRDAPGNQGYREVLKENEKYWEYYKQQNVFPLEQFDEFKAALQRDLPVSFRFQGCHKDREQLIHEMENRFFGKIVEAEETAVCVPKSLPCQSQSQSQYMDGSSLSGWSQSQTRPRRGYQRSTQQMSQDMDDMEQKMSDLLMSQDC